MAGQSASQQAPPGPYGDRLESNCDQEIGSHDHEGLSSEAEPTLPPRYEGKGGKDRYMAIAPAMVVDLGRLWPRHLDPRGLFPGLNRSVLRQQITWRLTNGA